MLRSDKLYTSKQILNECEWVTDDSFGDKLYKVGVINTTDKALKKLYDTYTTHGYMPEVIADEVVKLLREEGMI